MSRMDALEARRRALLARCEEQRIELTYRVAQLAPVMQVSAWTRRLGPQAAANHPIAWIAGLIGIVLMLRPRRFLTVLTWLTGAVALASQATTLLRVFRQVRTLYMSLKSERR